MASRTFRIHGEQIDVAARRAGEELVLAGGDGPAQSWQVRRVGAAEFAVHTQDGRAHTLFAIRHRGSWWVHLDGRTYHFEAVIERGSGGTAAGGLSSPIPATVMEVLVANGDAVDAEQVLVVLSAMKMQLEIRAPHAGIVEGLNVNAEDSVDGGEQLLTVVAAEEGSDESS